MSAISPEKEKKAEAAAGPEKKAAEDKTAGAGSSPDKTKSSSSSDELKLKEAMGNLAAGKRNLIINDVSGAVSSFAEACKMMGEIYGETAAECGEAFFYYGKALLEMARMENGVLENGLGGVPDGEDKECSNIEDPEKMTEEEKEDVAEKVGEAIEIGNQKAEEEKAAVDAKKAPGDKPKDAKAAGAKKDESSENSAEEEEEAGGEEGASAEGKEGEGEEKPEDGGDEEEAEAEGEGGENESIGSNEAGPSTAKETEDKSAVEAEDDDDPSSLQLAWEMLELAKQCLKKQADALPADDPKRPEVEGRLSETFMKLGEVSIESENYPQAIDDLNTCLRRHQEHLPDDSRCIAEAHYQIGVALGFNLEFDPAVTSLEDAIGVLEKRVRNLKEKKESENPSNKDDAFYTREREIEEIESLVPEIREKIADTRDMQVETNKKLGDKVLAEEKEMEAIAAPTAEPSPTKKSANGVGVKSTAAAATNGTTNGSADGDKKDTNGATNDISHMVKKRKKSDPAEGGAEAKKTKEAENGATAASATSA